MVSEHLLIECAEATWNQRGIAHLKSIFNFCKFFYFGMKDTFKTPQLYMVVNMGARKIQWGGFQFRLTLSFNFN